MKTFLLCLCCCISTSLLFAQSDRMLSVSAFSEATTLFPTQEGKRPAPLHLGFAVSLDILRKEKGNYQFSQTFQLGYYYHKNLHHALFAAWKPKFEMSYESGFNVHALPGIGYVHTLPDHKTYQQIDGVFEEKRNWGKGRFIPSVGFGMGYTINRESERPIELFTRYEWFFIAPYAYNADFFILSGTMFSIGTSFSPFKK